MVRTVQLQVWCVLSYYPDPISAESGQLIDNQIWEFCFSDDLLNKWRVCVCVCFFTVFNWSSAP